MGRAQRGCCGFSGFDLGWFFTWSCCSCFFFFFYLPGVVVLVFFFFKKCIKLHKITVYVGALSGFFKIGVSFRALGAQVYFVKSTQVERCDALEGAQSILPWR